MTEFALEVVRDIYLKAKAEGIRISALSKSLRCQQISPCHGGKYGISYNAVSKLVSSLGGELFAEWKD
jgi:hypothetical protein